MLLRRGLGVVAVGVALIAGPMTALAGHMAGWTHDHSGGGVPYRPNGYNDIVRVYGQPCSAKTQAARSWWPHVSGRNSGAYLTYNAHIARNVSHNVQGHVSAAHKTAAWDYGQWAYACRSVRGGSGWSTHAFGAAIDTNTLRNPQGQCSWNGLGANGSAHGTYVPDVFKAHNFRWGLDWCDPHHFQYATGY